MKPLNVFVSMILAEMFLSACNLSLQSAGPRTWIDQPLAGIQAPLAPLTIQAHASDADGVDTIEFYVADRLVTSVSTGGGRLGEAIIQWTPPAAGVYIISVSAVDAQGNAGAKTSVQVSVVTMTTPGAPTTVSELPQCAPDSLTAPTLVSPADGSSVTPDPLLAWSYPAATCHPYGYKIDISENASFSDVGWGFGTLDFNETSRSWPLPGGKCYYWRVMAYVPDVNGPPSPAWKFCVEDARTGEPASTPASIGAPQFTLEQNAHCREGPGTVYDSVDVLMEGAVVAIKGRNEENTWFWILKPSGSSHCWISASVGVASGNWQTAPLVSAPPLPVTATSPADLVLPAIAEVSANPSLVSLQVQCGSTPATTIVQARVTDDSGIASVVARVSGVGEFDMSPVGDGYYQIILGPFGEAGTLSVFVQAQDNAGNTAASAPIEVQVVACPG